MRRIPVIDAVRFLAAAIVVLHHGSIPPVLEGHALAYREMFFGSSAVVVFFVVSGLCIHGPLMDIHDVDWRSYFIRRLVRILLPIAVIVPLGAAFNVSYHPFYGWVTWSLMAELVYYCAYPGLRAARLRYGWPIVIAVSFFVGYVSLAVWSIDPENHWLRLSSDIISNLPAWLLGCALAETMTAPARRVWIKRMAVVVGSLAVAYLHYELGLRFNWTLPAFSVLVAIWLKAEMATEPRETFLSRAGQWSYSLYLVHPLVLFGIAPQSTHSWSVTMVIVIIFSYLFFLIVESPSHRLARRLISGAPRFAAKIQTPNN